MENIELYTIDSLIEWLDTQDPNKTYQYGSIWNCLISQYLTAKGEIISKEIIPGYCNYTYKQGDAAFYERWKFEHPIADILINSSTFGQATKKLKRKRYFDRLGYSMWNSICSLFRRNS